ncbi:MAG: sugar ABC transporter substrate-binding protein [Candidatus Devosia phytovorans]|uniref:Sugar ABC transporter substrate-binding protein n=1 Tax=Candidatus Devosia phytovorans TaxID=3121372 RepID=A0AAJ6AZE6_9HYPH|nr:sugar ABC transporter substrate-binding protein [Devosia sp.]WEK04505.1 MAG: sugar ABC transporter substrate-binding protein [Devosia sp.]
MNKNWTRSAAMTLLVAAGVYSASAHAQETVQLTFRQFDPPTEIEGLVKAIDAWNAAHPDIQVKLETMAGADTLAQLAREVPAGAGPDIQHMAFVWTRDLARSGLVADLTDHIAASPPGAGIEDFLATDLATLDGKVYGIPWTSDTFAMAYRPDLLDAAGIAFPETWDELRTAAGALTTGDGQYGFCFPAGSSPDSGMWTLANYYLWSNGSTLVDETLPGKWEVVVKPEELVAAMTYFNDFFVNQSSPESLITVNSWGDPEIMGGLGRGDCAIAVFPPQTFRAAEAQSEAALMTAKIPQGEVRRISHLGGRALGINPNSKHPEEAWQFVQYLVSADTFATYQQYPAQNSLLEELQFPPTEQGYVEMLPLAQTFERYISSPIPVSTMTALINREFGAVYSGQRSPDEAAQAVIAELQDLLARGKS